MKQVYLTIDDAPSTDCLNKLDFLDAHGIRAVWFCQGSYMEQRPEMIIEAIRRGHVAGNHTYGHPHFSDLTEDQAYAEIRSTDTILEELYRRAGVARRHRFFRFPYGDKGAGTYGNVFQKPDAAGQAKKDAVQTYLRRLGYTLPAFPGITYAYYRAAGLDSDVDWYWTYNTLDWALLAEDAPFGMNSVEKLKARMDEDRPEEGQGLNHSHSDDIVVIHDHPPTARVFVSLIEHFLAKNIHFALPA